SEQTAAAEGKVGQLRRDPFAMLPFCGYNMADYWSHWLGMGEKLGDKAPKVYQVNWFRRGDDGSFRWPGFSENSRVLEWVTRRVAEQTEATDGATGRLPVDLNLEGLDISAEAMDELFAVDPEAWQNEADQ